MISWIILLLVILLIIFITAYIIAAAAFLFYTATRTLVEEERIQYARYRNTCTLREDGEQISGAAVTR